MNVTIPDKVRKVVYWATLILSALSAILMGVAAALGVVDPGAVQKGAEVSALVLGILSPIFALFHFTPNSPE